MTPNTIGAVSAVAGLITSLAALLTILEMRRQRRSNYQPEVIIEEATFRVYRRLAEGKLERVAVSTTDTKPSDSLVARTTFSLECRNIGRGVAHQVQARMTFDARRFAEVLAPHEGFMGGRVWADGQFIEFESKEGMAWIAVQGYEQRLGTMLPAPDARIHSVDVIRPYESLFNSCVEVIAGGLDDTGDHLVMGSVPPLRVELSYRDMVGLQHNRIQYVTPSISHLIGAAAGRSHEPGWHEIGGGSIDVRDA